MHRSRIALLLAPIACGACSLHSVATHWNGRVGPDGVPVYVRTVTNIGLNILVVLPVLGNTSMDEMIDESTHAIAAQDSDHVRVIESSSENYWHGFPPLTWILTPVITEVAVEYRPSEAERAAVAAAERRADAAAEARQDEDHSSVIPTGHR